jgi:L-ascorbate metabolism protein UlaG (beta-lactamase superfamily)
MTSSCASEPSYPLSDHYDGKRFFNPKNPQDHRFYDLIKFIVTRDKKVWPDRVENEPALNLSGPLFDNEVAVTFVNHATVLLQLNGYAILTDPVWSERVGPIPFIGPKRVRKPGIPFDQLPKIDIVLISHNHYDHLDLETLKKMIARFQPIIFAPLGDKSLIQSLGAQHVHEMDWWDSIKVGRPLEITFAPTQHFSGRRLFSFDKSLWGSYVINVNGRKIYFGGDSGYSPHYKDIEHRYGPMDLSFLPIGSYEPRWFMKAVHMNPEENVLAHRDLQSRETIGIHFGTFQLSDERIGQPQIELAAALKKLSVAPDTFIVLKEGQTRIFKLDHE